MYLSPLPPRLFSAHKAALLGLGFFGALSAGPARAHYADWTATLPTERPGTVTGFGQGSGPQCPNPGAFTVLKSDGSISTWRATGSGGGGLTAMQSALNVGKRGAAVATSSETITATLSGSVGADSPSDIGQNGTVTLRASHAGDANHEASRGLLVSFDGGKSNQTITFGMIPAATYPIEWSDTLEAGRWSTQTATEPIHGSRWALDTVKASIPTGSGGSRFHRLRVGSAPVQTP